MTPRRRLKGAYLLGSLLLLTASLHPLTAYAAAGDPPAGSPAGAIYQLPLEQGRSDAAPKGSGGTTAGGGDSGSGGGTAEAGEAGSLYRTENNFGSSSRVPGAPSEGSGGAGAEGTGARGAGAAVAAGAAGAGGAGGSGGGGSGTGGGPGGGAAGVAAAPTTAAGEGNTSVLASAVLLGAIGLLAAAVGSLSRRSAPRRAGGH